MEKQKMKIKRKVIEKSLEFEVKSDIIVPDIKPDVVAIKATNLNAYICKEEISRGKLRFEGRLDRLCYLFIRSRRDKKFRYYIRFYRKH